MKLVNLNCPACGAALQADADRKNAVCPCCGSAFLIDDEAVRLRIDGAEQAGYDFEKGRQRAQAEQAARQAPAQGHQPPVRKRRTWLWVLGWICIFPVPLTILMVRNKKLNLYARIAIIALAWIAYFLIGCFGGDKQNVKTPEATTEQSVVCIESSAF